MRWLTATILSAAALASGGGCGGGSTPTVLMTLTATGFTPGQVSVRYGYDLKFVNQDTAAHQPASLGCPDLNGSVIPAGQSRTVTVGLDDVGKSCDLYDAQPGASGSYSGIVRVTGSG